MAGLLMVGLERPALAEPTEQERVMANALFQEARQLMTEGRYAQACPKFQESQRLQPGGGTLLNLGLCHEREGKLASAWGELQTALAQARKDKRDDRENLAIERLAIIETTLAYFTVSVPDESKVPGLTIKLDGASIPEAAWQSGQPIDPGSHELEASAPGHKTWRSRVAIDVARQRAIVAVPPLKRGIEPQSGKGDAGLNSQHFGAITAGALSVVGVGLGIGFGVAAANRWSTSDDNCPTSETCTAEGADAAEETPRLADISTVSFILAGTAAALGTVLWITAPSMGGDARDEPGAAGAVRFGIDLGPLAGGARIEGVF